MRTTYKQKSKTVTQVRERFPHNSHAAYAKSKNSSVAQLQPAQPFEILKLVGGDRNIVNFQIHIISGGEKCLMSIAMESASCSF